MGGTGGFADGFGEGDKIVGGGGGGDEFTFVAYQIPASGGGEAGGVVLAEIVRVGFGVRGERADDGGGVGVDVGQGGDRRVGATGPGAAPW